MRKGWKITAQRLFATSAISILAVLPGTGYSGDNAQVAGAEKVENPKFRSDAEGLQRALQIQLEFLADTTVSSTDITANYLNGKIVLKGNSNQQVIAKKARQIAEKNSTLPIKEEIRIWPFPSLSPQKASLETLQKSAEKTTNLELAAMYPKLKAQAHKDGTITIRGPIVSLEDKVEVSKRLRKIPGCLKVENLLEIQPMVHGSRTVQLISKDGQKYLPVASKPTPEGMTPLPETWPVFQTVKSEEPTPPVSEKVVVPAQSVEKPKKSEATPDAARPKELPGSLNSITKPTEKTQGNQVELLAPPSLPAFEPAKPAALPEFKAATPPPAPMPIAKPLTVDPVLTPVIPAPIPLTPDFLPKVDATPTSGANNNPPKFQAIPTPKNTIIDKPKDEPLPVTKSNAKAAGQQSTMQAPKAQSKVWAPAHDPKGSVTVRTDALGFPPISKDVPPTQARQKDQGKIPAQYLATSDKNPSYDRPYLAVKNPAPTAPAPTAPAKDNSKPNQTMVAKAQIQAIPLAPVKPATEVAKATFPKVEAKTASSKKTTDATQSVPPGMKANPVSSKKEQEPKVGTGTITFDDEEETTIARSKPSPRHESLRSLILSSCKGEVNGVTVTDQANGKTLVTVQMIKGKPAANVARKLFNLPEFSTDKITLDIKD